MIDTLVHKYKIKIKNSNLSKSVAFLKLKEAITTENLADFMEELRDLKKQDHDSYVVVLNNEKLLSALTIKVLLAFYNSVPEKIGILTNSGMKAHSLLIKLNKYIDIEKSPREVLLKIEMKKLRMDYND